MTCLCKESCAHQKSGFCSLSAAERASLEAKSGPRDGDGVPGG